MPDAYRAIVLDVVGSTNREALLRADRGERGPLWVVARRQTAGRGRSGRQWASEPGNLYASLLVDLACSPAVVPQLSLVAGVAVVDAMRKASGTALAGLRLKWPNDVLIADAKCAGILAESVSGQGSVLAVIGIGINLAWHPDDVGQPVTSLSAHGARITPETMLDALAPAVAQWLDVWGCGAGFEAVRQAWMARAGAVGERCSVNTGTERIEGAYAGLDESGALLMRDRDGRQRTISFGDVMLLGATTDGSDGP